MSPWLPIPCGIPPAVEPGGKGDAKDAGDAHAMLQILRPVSMATEWTDLCSSLQGDLRQNALLNLEAKSYGGGVWSPSAVSKSQLQLSDLQTVRPH